MIRTAIYGGTFDPIHIGHIDVAKAVLDEKVADEIIFMPNYISPFKQNEIHSSGDDRRNMIKEALKGIEHAYVSDYELSRKGPSYTIDTLLAIEKELGEKVSFVAGADSLLTMETWHRGPEILKGFTVIAVKRPNISLEDTNLIIRKYQEKYDSNIILLNKLPHNISSTEVREKVIRGEPIADDVTPGVEKYIITNGLYLNEYRITNEIKIKLKSLLSKKRYQHSIGVASMARKLAIIYGEDADKAYFAGYIHDIAKCITVEESNRLVRYYGLDHKYINNVQLAHSKVGAMLAHDVFGIRDNDILNAIAYHTTAREDMSMLEEILYVSDAIEVNRQYPEVEELRRKSEVDIDKVCLFILNFSIEDIRNKGKELDIDTIYAKEWIVDKIKRRTNEY